MGCLHAEDVEVQAVEFYVDNTKLKTTWFWVPIMEAMSTIWIALEKRNISPRHSETDYGASFSYAPGHGSFFGLLGGGGREVDDKKNEGRTWNINRLSITIPTGPGHEQSLIGHLSVTKGINEHLSCITRLQ